MTENLPDTNVGNIEYIRKQDALDAFGLSEKTRKYGGDHSGYDTRMLYEIQDTIESLEPADVAPAVRCENCVHWSDSNQCERPELAGNRWHDDKYFETLPDDFCSYGERREE